MTCIFVTGIGGPTSLELLFQRRRSLLHKLFQKFRSKPGDPDLMRRIAKYEIWMCIMHMILFILFYFLLETVQQAYNKRTVVTNIE